MKKHLLAGGVAGLVAVFILVGITNAGTDSPIIDRIVASLKSLAEKITALDAKLSGIKQPIVSDANGVKVGILLGNEGDTNADGFQINYGTLEVYDVNHEVTARLDAFTGQAIIDHNFATKFLLFTTPDCTGQAYVSNINATEFGEILNNTHTLVVRAKSPGPDALYAGNAAVGTVTDVLIQSQLLPSDDCNSISKTYPMATAVDPISMSYVGPLQINLE